MGYIHCKKCGCQMSDKSEACPQCGTPTIIIETTISTPSETATTLEETEETIIKQETAKPKRRCSYLIIYGGICLLILLSIEAWLIFGDTNAMYNYFYTMIDDTIMIDDYELDKYIRYYYDTDKDNRISRKEAEKVTEIYCQNLGIKTLKGIEWFPALEILSCSDNQLTSIDLSRNTQLRELYCHNNMLNDLDVSRNNKLTLLSCSQNKIRALDLSQNTILSELYCSDNQLTTLDVSNNTSLTTLFCRNNNLTTIDVSRNLALTTFSCSMNRLKSIDVSYNTALIVFSCYSNPLELLNLGETAPMEYYYDADNYESYPYFYNNKLGSSTRFKIISHNITRLNVSYNNLQTLDVSECPALKILECCSNQLPCLDISKTNMNVGILDCSSMTTLQTLLLRTGWNINFITRNRSANYIPSQTEIVYVN